MTLCVEKDEIMSVIESSEPLHSETTPESTPHFEVEHNSVNFYTNRDLAEQRIKSHKDKQRKRRAEGQSTQRLSDEFYTSELKAWRCTARSSHNCHVHIHTDRVDGKIVVVKRIGKHTPLPKSTSTAVREVMLSFKIRLLPSMLFFSL